MHAPQPSQPAPFRDMFTPKLVTALRDGYTSQDFKADALAGLTVAIVALPLAMAIAIASGTTPDRGLVTAVVAGFLISAFGGSRYQIGGPTAAFIVVVFQVIEEHGLAGLTLATLMAGALLVVLGLMRLGTYIKYIPYPVITGFTAGIAVSIAASQVKEALGLDAPMPADFAEKIAVIAAHIGETRPETVAVTLAAVALVVGLRRFRPHWPGFLIVVVLGSLAVALLGLDAATVGERYGAVPSSIPAPSLPPMDWALVRAVIPDALTIALLAGVESLLSAVVADGMTGRRHRSNCELVAQGIANIASALFGGISATGAIARTATNIRSGARTPVAGMLHAVFLLAFMLLAAPLLSYVPLAVLAGILLIVAWSISEAPHVRDLLRSASPGDRFVLVGTFLLTVLTDVTVGIAFGVVVAAVLFVHEMAEAVEVETHERLIEEDRPDSAPGASEEGDRLPADVVVYRIRGPFFFGAAQRVTAVLDRIGERPGRLLLDLSGVPFVDSTGGAALKTLALRAKARGTRLFAVGATPLVEAHLDRLGLTSDELPRHRTVADAVAASGG